MAVDPTRNPVKNHKEKRVSVVALLITSLAIVPTTPTQRTATHQVGTLALRSSSVARGSARVVGSIALLRKVTRKSSSAMERLSTGARSVVVGPHRMVQQVTWANVSNRPLSL